MSGARVMGFTTFLTSRDHITQEIAQWQTPAGALYIRAVDIFPEGGSLKTANSQSAVPGAGFDYFGGKGIDLREGFGKRHLLFFSSCPRTKDGSGFGWFSRHQWSK